MKIIRPYAKLLSPVSDFMNESNVLYKPFTKQDGINCLKRIEWAARISHRSEEEQKESSYERFIKAVVLTHGDWSVVEHATVSVDCVTDRGITHEIVRHRLFGYTQESTRFVNYEKKMPPSFIYPKPDVECIRCLAGEQPTRNDAFLMGEDVGWYLHSDNTHCAYDLFWLDAILVVEAQYRSLLRKGWRPQEARSVFPNALASRIVITGNLRNWRHFFLMRTTKEAHPQMRQIMQPLLLEFKEKIPVLFDDIEPNARQVDNIAKGR